MLDRETELRTDLFSGRQVLIAEGRAARPQQTGRPELTIDEQTDPFLEGHESETPSERLALRLHDSAANEGGWLLRVVPNRYPAVRQSAGKSVGSTSNDAVGLHDVVIECPDARTSLLQFSVAEIARVLKAWQLRVTALMSEPGIRHVSVFRNEGARAGASLPHAHSQILATGFLPAAVTLRRQREQQSLQDTGATLLDRWLQQEQLDGRRIVRQNQDLLISCPDAPQVAWHTRISPLSDPVQSFVLLEETQILQLATNLRRTLCALADLLGSYSCNLLLHLPPAEAMLQQAGLQANSWPWMLDIVPRTSGIAGYELMTDVDIVTVSPETARAKLRERIDCSDTVGDAEIDEANSTDGNVLCPPGYGWR
ncbi:MAG: galactose-1-phosphate uridylyltransferase [Fuerstiella sp.]